jgi:nucleoside-diphosphate-sugar epimerase
MASDERDPVNLGNPNEATILQLAERIRQMTGSGSTIVRQPLPQDDPTRRQPDITRARERLGWQPTIEIEAGLSATIDYFRSRLAAPDQIGG